MATPATTSEVMIPNLSLVIVIILSRDKVVVVPAAATPAREVPTIVAAKPIGAAEMLWVASRPARAAADAFTPRLANRPRSFSRARATRIRAASSLRPSVAPTSDRWRPSK